MNFKKLTISVIGLGYIGLPILLKIASVKKIKEINGVDIDKQKINDLISNKYYFTDPILKKYFSNYKYKINFADNIIPSNLYFITISNSKKLNDKFYLNNIINLLDQIIKLSKNKSIIILETTLNIGFSEKIINFLKKNPNVSFFEGSKKKYDMCFCYMAEKIIPGNTISELSSIPRIISTTNNSYKPLITKIINTIFNSEVIFDDFKITEYVKIIENTYRNYSIGFSNYLSIYFMKNKINFSKIFKYANLHPRINILSPSIGIGGHCIPLDPLFLINKLPVKNNPISEAYKSNINKEKWVIKYIQFIKANLNKKIIILGLTYKENIDDTRESASIRIINKLSKSIGDFYGYDPFVPSIPDTIRNKNFFLINQSDLLKNLKSNRNGFIYFIFIKHEIFKKYTKQIKKSYFYDFCGLFDYEYIIA